jgi:hypothetical protein
MFRKLVVLLAAPLLAVSACATEADVVALDPIAAIRAVPAATDAAGSARFEMTVSTGDADSALEITSTGGFDGTRMTMEVDFGAALAGALGSTDAPLPDGIDEPMRLVADGSTIYLRVPVLDAPLDTPGWLSATAEDLGAAGGPLGFAGGVTDPSQLLDTLRSVAGDVEEVGSDDVRGVATTHYRAALDLARALAQLPDGGSPLLEHQLEDLGTELDDVPVDLWVDADGLARRLVLEVGDLGALTVELFDYGEPVEIDVPAPEETTPITDVLGTLGALGGLG